MVAAIVLFRFIKDWCLSINNSMRGIWKMMGAFENLAGCFHAGDFFSAL